MGKTSGGRPATLRSWESHPSAVLAEPSFNGSIIIPSSTSSPPLGAAPAFAVDLVARNIMVMADPCEGSLKDADLEHT